MGFNYSTDFLPDAFGKAAWSHTQLLSTRRKNTYFNQVWLPQL